MRLNKFLAVALLSAATMTVARAQCPCVGSNQRYEVEVNASAKMLVTPNKIEVRVVLSQEPSKGKISMSELENKLIAAVRYAGLDPQKDMKIVSQSSDYGRKTDVFGFKAYNVTLASSEETARLFDKLSEGGIAQVSVINITHTDLEVIQQQVKAQAMINARQTAKTVAEAVGQKIGMATYINVSNGYYPRPTMPLFMRSAKMDGNAMGESAAQEPDIQFRDLEVEQSVTAKFELLETLKAQMLGSK